MANAMRSTVMKKTLREQVADVLRHKILRGELKPGQRIIESELSELFEISRAPVREALRQLEEEGMITYASHKGCVVKTLSYRDIQEAYLIRSTLEVLAVKVYEGKLSDKTRKNLEACIDRMEQAAKEKDLVTITEEDEFFHELLVEESGCERLLRMWKSLEGANAATYYTMDREALMPFTYLAANHQKILDSFEAEDSAFSGEIIKQHYMVVPNALLLKHGVESVCQSR